MRNLFLDYFRGLAIIIVMIGHAIQINLSNNETSFVWNVILSFQMPLLFLISGYTAGLSYPTTGTKKAIINKVKKILLPYTIFAVFHYLVISIVTNNFNYIDLLTSLFESDFWFLRVLFICFLIIYITNFLQKRAVNNCNCIIQALFLLLSFLIIYFINILFNFRIIEPYYYLWFLVGLIIHLLLKGLSLKNKLIINLTRIINKFRLMIGLISIFSLYFLSIYSQTNTTYLSTFSLCVIIGIVSFYFYKMLPDKIKDFFYFHGTNSLYYYALHWCFLFSPCFHLGFNFFIFDVKRPFNFLVTLLIWDIVCSLFINLKIIIKNCLKIKRIEKSL